MTLDWFSSSITKQLQQHGATLTDTTIIQQRVVEAFEKNDIPTLKNILVDIRGKWQGFNGAELDQYLQIVQGSKRLENIKTTVSIEDKYGVIAQAILNSIKTGEDKQIISLDAPLSFEEVKTLVRTLLMNPNYVSLNFDDITTLKYPFIITNQKEIKGRIYSKIYEGKKEILLLEFLKNKNEEMIHFFGEKADTRAYTSRGRYQSPFYMYRFITENNEPYIVLSREELDLSHMTIRGMISEVRDNEKIGEIARIFTNIPVMFVHSAVPLIQKRTAEEILAITKTWTHDIMANNVFGGYRHPKNFEKLIFAWLFGGKVSGFPLHLAIVSQAGTGKSMMLDALSTQFSQKVFEGGTMKGLVPSFGGRIPEEGYLAKSQRISLIDEFFGILRKSGRTGGLESVDNGTDMMNSLLEHKSRSPMSGRGDLAQITTKPQMKVLFTSNTKAYHKLENMVEISANLNNAFLSRFLWLVQGEGHIEFIDAHKSDIQIEEAKKKGNLYPQQNPKFIEVFDYLYSITLPIPKGVVDRIFKTYVNLIPEECAEIYRSRAKHHICCLIDGVSKYNSIVERRGEFKVEGTDVADAERLFAMCVLSWNTNINFSRVPLTSREDFLTYEEGKVFRGIQMNGSIEAKDVSSFVLDRLVQFELVFEKDGRYYPFSQREIKEIDVEANEF